MILPPDRSHYLSVVLRAQPGMAVRLFNATSGEWEAQITAVTKKAVTLLIMELARAPLPEPERCLLFAPIKRSNLEWLIEKATELGVSRFVPVLTERTQVREVNHERLSAIAMEAAEQCERLSVPQIDALLPLPNLLAHWPAERTIHAALERSDAPTLASTNSVSTILIGPEGGFTDGEQAMLQQQSFIQPVTLGPRILRAETAGLAALAYLALQDY